MSRFIVLLIDLSLIIKISIHAQTHYSCLSNEPCVKNCTSHTCEQVIQATNATSLNLSCYNNYCYNTQVVCPHDSTATCQINCGYRGCQYMQVNYSLTQNLIIQCDGYYSCQGLQLLGPQTYLQTVDNNTKAAILCTSTAACYAASFDLNYIHDADISCSYSSSFGACRSAYFYINYGENVNIDCLYYGCNGVYIEGKQVSNQMTVHCNAAHACHESFIHVENANNFTLNCSSDKLSCGFMNIYPNKDIQHRKIISCGIYGCYGMNIYVEDDYALNYIGFESRSTSINSSISMICSSRGTSTVFYNAATQKFECDINRCCPWSFGDILCSNANDKCIINCTDIDCKDLVINAMNASLLTVSCDSNSSYGGCRNTVIFGPRNMVDAYKGNPLKLNIHCPDKYSCLNTEIFSFNADELNLLCHNNLSCANSHLYGDNTAKLNIECISTVAVDEAAHYSDGTVTQFSSFAHHDLDGWISNGDGNAWKFRTFYCPSVFCYSLSTNPNTNSSDSYLYKSFDMIFAKDIKLSVDITATVLNSYSYDDNYAQVQYNCGSGYQAMVSYCDYDNTTNGTCPEEYEIFTYKSQDYIHLTYDLPLHCDYNSNVTIRFYVHSNIRESNKFNPYRHPFLYINNVNITYTIPSGTMDNYDNYQFESLTINDSSSTGWIGGGYNSGKYDYISTKTCPLSYVYGCMRVYAPPTCSSCYTEAYFYKVFDMSHVIEDIIMDVDLAPSLFLNWYSDDPSYVMVQYDCGKGYKMVQGYCGSDGSCPSDEYIHVYNDDPPRYKHLSYTFPSECNLNPNMKIRFYAYGVGSHAYLYVNNFELRYGVRLGSCSNLYVSANSANVNKFKLVCDGTNSCVDNYILATNANGINVTMSGTPSDVNGTILAYNSTTFNVTLGSRFSHRYQGAALGTKFYGNEVSNRLRCESYGCGDQLTLYSYSGMKGWDLDVNGCEETQTLSHSISSINVLCGEDSSPDNSVSYDGTTCRALNLSCDCIDSGFNSMTQSFDTSADQCVLETPDIICDSNKSCTIECSKQTSGNCANLAITGALSTSLDVLCNTDCEGTIIYCPFYYDDCQLECSNTIHVCDYTEIYAGFYQDIDIDCQDDYSCNNVLIVGDYGMNINLNCDSTYSCNDINIYGDYATSINIECYQSFSCNDIIVYGTFAESININCYSHWSCNSFSINADNITSNLILNCLSNSACRFLFTIDIDMNQSFTYTPTAMPTSFPSDSPSILPTDNPSIVPTVVPSFQPTENPSENPTTPRPTEHPTDTPTNLPATPSPTTTEPTTFVPTETSVFETTNDSSESSTNMQPTSLLDNQGQKDTGPSLGNDNDNSGTIVVVIVILCLIGCGVIAVFVYRKRGSKSTANHARLGSLVDEDQAGATLDDVELTNKDGMTNTKMEPLTTVQ